MSKLIVSTTKKDRTLVPITKLAKGMGPTLCVERELNGLSKTLLQRTYFVPKKNRLFIEIVDDKKMVAMINIKLNKMKNETYALISWIETLPEFGSKGLMEQLLSEAIFVLKEAGVKGISANVLGGLSTYRKFDFSEKTNLGEKWVYKELN